MIISYIKMYIKRDVYKGVQESVTLKSRALGKEKESIVLIPELVLPFCSKTHTVPQKASTWGLHPVEVSQTGVNRDLLPLKSTLHVFELNPKGLPTQ